LAPLSNVRELVRDQCERSRRAFIVFGRQHDGVGDSGGVSACVADQAIGNWAANDRHCCWIDAHERTQESACRLEEWFRFDAGLDNRRWSWRRLLCRRPRDRLRNR
jgi:hypothetical protein